MINFFVSLFIVSFHCPLHSNHLRSHFNVAVLLHLHFAEFLFIFQMIHVYSMFICRKSVSEFSYVVHIAILHPVALCNLFRTKEQKHLIHFMLQLESIRQNVPKGFKCYNNHIILKLIQLCTFICQNVLCTQLYPLSLTLPRLPSISMSNYQLVTRSRPKPHRTSHWNAHFQFVISLKNNANAIIKH